MAAASCSSVASTSETARRRDRRHPRRIRAPRTARRGPTGHDPDRARHGRDQRRTDPHPATLAGSRARVQHGAARRGGDAQHQPAPLGGSRRPHVCRAGRAQPSDQRNPLRRRRWFGRRGDGRRGGRRSLRTRPGPRPGSGRNRSRKDCSSCSTGPRRHAPCRAARASACSCAATWSRPWAATSGLRIAPKAAPNSASRSLSWRPTWRCSQRPGC